MRASSSLFFTNDPLSERALTILRTGLPVVVVSDFAAAEFASAIGRRVRMRHVSRDEGHAALATFDAWAARATRRVEAIAADIAAGVSALQRVSIRTLFASGRFAAIPPSGLQRREAGMTSFGLPKAERPQELGLSPERLERISATFRADVERGFIPGAVFVIARAGRVGYGEALGWRDREESAPMQPDALFRIASMTKPVVSVAAMMLAEEGRLQISAPVADYLPELAERSVGVERLRASRTMTVQDLLRHTSGLTYAQFGDAPVQMLWRDFDLMNLEQTNAELVQKLSILPLMFEPGTTWEYSMSTDVLGRVVEIVSGKSLGAFLTERIFAPLQMRDTGFSAAGERSRRVAEPQIDPATKKRPPMRNVGQPPRWESGGGGLVSTAADYLRFCEMLLEGGELDGVRLLAPKTIAHMASDHLPPGVEYGKTTRARFGALAPVPEMGYGFGLGFAVRTVPGRSPVPGSVGEFFWGGVTGTYFWIDPIERLVVVLMLQAPDRRLYYRYLSRALVYGAIVGPPDR
jgi:CubicO group peptidase (beta-lactamase class C family)